MDAKAPASCVALADVVSKQVQERERGVDAKALAAPAALRLRRRYSCGPAQHVDGSDVRAVVSDQAQREQRGAEASAQRRQRRLQC